MNAQKMVTTELHKRSDWIFVPAEGVNVGGTWILGTKEGARFLHSSGSVLLEVNYWMTRSCNPRTQCLGGKNNREWPTADLANALRESSDSDQSVSRFDAELGKLLGG